MATRKPRIEYYWLRSPHPTEMAVNWRLIGANGEIMCQSTQGFRGKADARRAVDAVLFALNGWDSVTELVQLGTLREIGPGKKPS